MAKTNLPYSIQPYRYFSPLIPMSAIRRYARRIAERFEPEKIILFGSYAYGEPNEESDVDLLVIMPTRNAIDQAIRIKTAIERPFSLDLIVRTPLQIARGLKDSDWFLREITEKGKVLYEAANRPVGSQGRGGLAGRTLSRQRQPASPRRRVLSLPASRGRLSCWVCDDTMMAANGPLTRELMTATVRQLLDSFDALSDTDKHQAAVEILRRLGEASEGDLPEETLLQAADELFCALDAEEASHAPR